MVKSLVNTSVCGSIHTYLRDKTASRVLPFGEVRLSQLVPDGGRRRVVVTHESSWEDGLGLDKVYRLYSMTKPIISIAILQLWERGDIHSLNAPVHHYLGDAWKKENMSVYVGNEMHPCTRDITIHHLLTHTSGISHGFFPRSNAVDRFYKEKLGINISQLLVPPASTSSPSKSLSQHVASLATAPLMFQPGSYYHYSFGTDVLAQVIQTLSTHSNLEEHLRMHVFDVCEMSPSTGFHLTSPTDQARLAPLYLKRGKGADLVLLANEYRTSQIHQAGSHGLFGTLTDYERLCVAIVKSALGTAGDQALASAQVMRSMLTVNQLSCLPHRVPTMHNCGAPHVASTEHPGFGFGYSCAVLDPALEASAFPTSQTMAYWTGIASTGFWIDLHNQLCVCFGSQVIEQDFGETPMLRDLSSLVYKRVF